MDKKRRRVQQFRGRLTAAEATVGINLARRNAADLCAEAQLLADHGHYARATSLAALSIEEFGKRGILRTITLARSNEEAAEEWKRYRTHTSKNQAWTFLDMVQDGARDLVSLRSMFDSSSDHPMLLDELKQLCFYSDYLSNGCWSDPADSTDESIACRLIETARIFSESDPITVEEMELWVELVGPVWKTSFALMAEAVSKWHRLLVERGLADGPDDRMEAFIYGGTRRQDPTGAT